MLYSFDSLVKIRWINKEICEYHRLRKMSFWEIFDFQCIYVAKLGCRPSLKTLRTFIMIRDDMTLYRCTYSSQSHTSPCHCPGNSLFQFFLSKKTKLTWTSSYSNKAFMNFHQTVMFQLLPGLISWYMLFQWQAIIADRESVKHAW